jgi:transcriptional regulator with XRE-family HTH domain
MDEDIGSQGQRDSARARLGRELRRLRKEAGMTQAALAERLGYVREYVTLAESDRELPSEEYLKRCGRFFGAAPHLLNLHRQAVAEREAGRRTLASPGVALGRPSKLTSLDFATLMEALGWWQTTREYPGEGGRAQGLDVRRRQFLGELAAALGVVAVSGPSPYLLGAEPWDRLAWALREPPTLDPSGLARLEAEIVSYRQQYAMVPSGRLLGRTLVRLHDVAQLLGQAPKNEILPQLYMVAGQTAGLAGWLFFDLHDHESAEQYYRVALDAAGRVKDHWVEAYVLGNTSFLAMFKGNVREALDMLEQARGLAGDGSSLVVRSWIAAVLAEAQSLTGNERACLAMLDEAEDYARKAPVDDPAADIFDTARLDGYRGVCLLRFSRPDEAHPILERALLSLRPELKRQRSNVLTDEALALLQLGALDESCKLALKSVEVVTTIRPAVGSARMRQLRGRYKPWRNHPGVKELDEYLWSV